MFRKWNRFLAFLLSLALVITTFGSDLATAKVYAEEGETTIEEAAEPEESAPEISEEIPEVEEVVEEVPAPAPEEPEEVIDGVDEEVGEEDPENPEGEDPENPEGEEEVKDPEEEPEAAEGEEKIVTVTYESGFGGSVSKESESIDINKEDAAFEGATATPWNDKYTFANWTKDGEVVSEDATFVPAGIEEDTTFKANFKAAENIGEEMPSISESKTTGGISVSVSAPAGLFPKGTTVSIEAIRDDVALATAQEAIPTATAAKGVDITFNDADGNEIQPANNKYVSVTMSLAEALEGDNFAVVHDHGDVETIGASISTDGEGNATGASFASNEFSVYIISNQDSGLERKVENYTFEVYDGSAWNVVSEQSIKSGETLNNPGIPDLESNQEFKGWFIVDGDTWGAEVAFGPKSDIAANADYKVRAKVTTTYHIVFKGVDGQVVQVKNVDIDAGQSTDITLDITVQPKLDTQNFTGWKNLKGDFYADGALLDASDPNNAVLVAEIEDGFWVNFDSNDGGAGGGASYIPPQFVKMGQKATRPANPTRGGYVFTDWYTTAECTTKFNFNTSINSATTIFAGWKLGKAPFTVIIQKQNLKDDKDASDAEKTYDYDSSMVITGYDADKEINASMLSAAMGMEFDGFTVNPNFKVVNLKADEGKKISPKGTTIVYVNYDRDLITYNFYTCEVKRHGSGWSSYYQVENIKAYNPSTFTGLYGQDLSEYGYVWPSERVWHEGKGISDAGSLSGTRMTFLSQFSTLESLDFYSTDTPEGEHSINHYAQNLNGTYPSDPTNSTQNSGYGTWYSSNKYRGFTVKEYSFDKNTWIPTHDGDSFQFGSAYQDWYGTWHYTYTDLYIRYERNYYNFTVASVTEPIDPAHPENITKTTPKEEQVYKLLYEAELSGKKEEAIALANSLTPPAGYMIKKDGDTVLWKDEAGSEPFEWDQTMPANNETRAYVVWTKGKYNVTLDLRADDVVIENDQKTNFKVWYDEKVDKGAITSNFKRAGYELVGWFNVSDNKPYDYGKVRADVNLYAKWRKLGGVKIVYQEKGTAVVDGETVTVNGTLPDEKRDHYTYAADSTVVVTAGATAPAGYTFIRWELLDKDDNRVALYYPNANFTIDDSYIRTRVEGEETINEVVLRAFYEKTGAGTDDVYTTVTYDPGEGTGTVTTISTVTVKGKTHKLRVNEAIQAWTADDAAGAGFAYAGHELIGWNIDKQAAKAGEKAIELGEEYIIADNEDNEGNPKDNTLYAVWKSNKGAYTIRYYEEYPDFVGSAPKLLGEKSYTEIDPGEVVSVPEGTAEGQIDWKRPAGYQGGVASPTSLTIVASEYDATGAITNPQYIDVVYSPITVTIKVAGKTYTKTFNGQDQTVPDEAGDLGFEVKEITYSATVEESQKIQDSEVALRDGLTLSVTGKEVDEYELSLNPEMFVCNNTNFEYVTFETENGKLIITPIDEVIVTIKGNQETKPYTGKEQSTTGYDVVSISNDLYTEEDFEYTGDSGAVGTDVGKYNMGLADTDFKNLSKSFKKVTFVIEEDGYLEITPRTVNLTIKGNISDPVKKFNGEKQQEKGFKEFKAEVIEVADVETPDFDITAIIYDENVALAEGITPNEYPMGLEEDMFKLNPEEKNFVLGEIDLEDGKLIIVNADEPIAISLTAEEIVSPYNGYTQKYVIRPGIGVVESENPVQATIDKIMGAIADFFTIKADAADEDLTFEYKGNDYTVKDLVVTAEGRDVGSYNFTYSEDYKVYLGEDDVTANFKINDEGLAEKLTITKAPLTITADNKSKVVGGAEPELTATVTGLLGEDLAIKAEYEEMLKDFYTLNRDAGEAVGSYTIHNNKKEQADFADINNYEVELVNGTFTITGTTPPPGPPTPPGPPAPPTPPATPAAPPAGAVLGATREVEGPQAAVLGARRGRTEDTANTTSRVIAVIIAAAVAATVLLTNKKKEEEEEA
ncbi:InlB B-repeat-containing protein [Butyrivibrio sp. VCB2001]|uniref:InlB B-repeat-containing protein n=1 Tax=Butyrivibrio sp. VCB2001 TaxID=1280667 RepID=UPI0004201AF7|nr:MBG domain-containing protein [Butyrivibrio sp. VCB2001]